MLFFLSIKSFLTGQLTLGQTGEMSKLIKTHKQAILMDQLLQITVFKCVQLYDLYYSYINLDSFKVIKLI